MSSKTRGNHKSKLQSQSAKHSSTQRNQHTGTEQRGKQGRKDSDSRRVNLDNERESKFIRQYEKRGMRQRTNDNANDVAWYARNAELLRAAASLPFGSVLGTKLFKGQRFTVPGVMIISFSFAYGGIENGAFPPNFTATWAEKYYPEAINQAGKSVYSFLVHANSRNYTYEYQDLQIVISAGTQVFAMLAHMVRAYSFAKTYSEKSVYSPEAFLTAMGFDPDDFRNHLGEIWFSLNQLIAQTTQIWIPSEAPLIKRWIWMCSSIFTDDDSALAQNYIFVPNVFQMYSENSVETGGCLEPATFKNGDNWEVLQPTSKTYTWDMWSRTLQHMIDRLVNSEDRGIMFGDILNAYGADRIFAFPQVPSDVVMRPTYSPEVLTQIENLTRTRAQVLGLRQDEKGLYPLLNTFYDGGYMSPIIAPTTPVLNFHQAQQPTPDQIVVATRLMAAGSYNQRANYKIPNTLTAEKTASVELATVTSGTGYTMPLAFGSELVYDVGYMWPFDNNDGSKWTIKWTAALSAQASPNDEPWTGLIPGYVLSFDWSPFIYGVKSISGTTLGFQGDVIQAFGDYDNYTVLSTDEVARLHQMALMSEFGLPIM